MQRLLQLLLHAYCDQRQNCPSSSYSFQKLLHLCAKGFVTKELPNLHYWMNIRTLQPTSFSSWCVSHVLRFVHYQSVMYWDSCIEWRDCRYITSPIGYWGKGSTIGWYQVLGFFLLITACFDKSGFSRVVTLNSPGGVLPWWFSPFINKSPKSNLFFAAFSLVGDFFVLPRLLHVIESN